MVIVHFFFIHKKSTGLSETCFDVKLTTKNWGSEIKWRVGECKSNREYQRDKIYIKQCCLPGGIHKLSCKDDWGDGWNGGFLEINGQKYCDNFNSYLHEEDIQIGSSSSPPPPPPIISSI